MSRTLTPRPLAPDAFAPFGDVLDARGTADRTINEGRCGRFHDRARLDFDDGRAGISIFASDTVSPPFDLHLVERHPLGSQAFLPLHGAPWLMIVAPAGADGPGTPSVFLVPPHTGVNLHRGTWHGVLTPLHAPGLFAVVDRIGDGANLEEHRFELPWRVVAGPRAEGAG